FGYEDEVRRGEDPEAVHNMRVVGRRLMAALRLFGGCFPKEELKPYQDAIRGTMGRLGDVRDRDVMMALLLSQMDLVPRAGENLLRKLMEEQMAQKLEYIPPLIGTLDALREENFPERFLEFVNTQNPAMSKERSLQKPYCQKAAPTLKKLLRRALSHEVRALENPEDVEALHIVRIDIKRLRYTMELFSPCLNRKHSKLLTKITHLQDALGQIHDHDIMMDYLKDRLTGASPRGRSVLGWLMALNRRGREILFQMFSLIGSQVRMKDLKRVLKSS
ncbi:MAG: CHAD domain-containing protein, partial [bacterium]